MHLLSLVRFFSLLALSIVILSACGEQQITLPSDVEDVIYEVYDLSSLALDLPDLGEKLETLAVDVEQIRDLFNTIHSGDSPLSTSSTRSGISGASPGSTSSPGPYLSSNLAQFRWGYVSGATSYRLVVMDVASRQRIVDRTLFQRGVDYRLPEGRQYVWQVGAYRNGSLIGTSSVMFFQIGSASVSPSISSISPNPVNVSSSRQWLTINGSNFVNPVTVDLWYGGTRYRISSDRVSFVSSSTIRIYAGITGAGTWGIDIYNPNGRSASSRFNAVSSVRGDDYPYKNDPANFNPNGCLGDRWRFCKRNCTSFVAHRLNQDGLGFHNYYRVYWGHAKNWNGAARIAGFIVDKNPTVGAVAQWPQSRNLPYGHVAYVAEVHSNGYVTIEEYNADNKGNYNSRRVLASSIPNYIHIR